VLDSPINARLFAPLLLALGLAMVVRTLTAGGGPFSLGVILGVLFMALGALRLYSSAKRRRADG
jgi:hypothetical protein